MLKLRMMVRAGKAGGAACKAARPACGAEGSLRLNPNVLRTWINKQ